MANEFLVSTKHLANLLVCSPLDVLEYKEIYSQGLTESIKRGKQYLFNSSVVSFEANTFALDERVCGGS